jgi:hypothetical protein
MATEKTEVPTFAFTSPVRTGFSNIVTGRAFQGKGDPRHDASFILEPDSADLTALKALVIAEAKKMFPGKKLVARRLTQEELDDKGTVEIQVPWKDGTKAADRAKQEGKDQEFFRGKIVVKASSKFAPALSGVENGAIVEYNNPEAFPLLAKKKFYAGSWVVPYVGVHAYKAMDEKPGGVGLWLNAVCFIKDGARTGGGKGVNAAEVFKAYAGTSTSVDPGSNELDDGEIPF